MQSFPVAASRQEHLDISNLFIHLNPFHPRGIFKFYKFLHPSCCKHYSGKSPTIFISDTVSLRFGEECGKLKYRMNETSTSSLFWKGAILIHAKWVQVRFFNKVASHRQTQPSKFRHSNSAPGSKYLFRCPPSRVIESSNKAEVQAHSLTFHRQRLKHCLGVGILIKISAWLHRWKKFWTGPSAPELRFMTTRQFRSQVRMTSVDTWRKTLPFYLSPCGIESCWLRHKLQEKGREWFLTEKAGWQTQYFIVWYCFGWMVLFIYLICFCWVPEIVGHRGDKS